MPDLLIKYLVFIGNIIFMKQDNSKKRLFEVMGRLDKTFKPKLNEDTDPCWDDHEMVGMKKKDGKEVPNCVPQNEVLGGHSDDPTKEEMINFLETKFQGLLDPAEAESNEFDMETAIYWFAHDYHGGQWSNLYSVLSTSEFKPSPLERGVRDLESGTATEMYNALVQKYGGEKQQYAAESFDKK